MALGINEHRPIAGGISFVKGDSYGVLEFGFYDSINGKPPKGLICKVGNPFCQAVDFKLSDHKNEKWRFYDDLCG
jgi:hypothetical protein